MFHFFSTSSSSEAKFAAVCLTSNAGAGKRRSDVELTQSWHQCVRWPAGQGTVVAVKIECCGGGRRGSRGEDR